LSTVFLFGAGASNGSLDCTPFRPPVGNGHDGLFAKLRAQGGVAAGVDGDLAAVFERNFEEGMAQFQISNPADLVRFQRHMARYFAQFEPGPNNLYRKLVRRLAATRTRFTLSTLNYDLLLELAVNAEGHGVGYPGIEYSPGSVPIFKLHGSCNFWPDIPPQMIQNIDFVLGPGHTAIEGPKLKAVSAAEVITLCQRENSIAPAITLYAKGKRVLICSHSFESHPRYWYGPLGKATSVYVIGVAVNPEDHHIWDPLATCNAELFYVAPAPAGRDFLQWAEEHRKRKGAHHHFADSFEQALTILSRKLKK